jgi:RHS repeat-associated protein
MELRLTTATNTVTATRYYTHNGQTVAVRTGAGVTWMSADQHGTSQVAITNTATQPITQRRETPYGAPRGTNPAWPTPRGFVDGINDPTGLTHLGAREYDPGIGRFVSVDPVLNTADPQQMNGYAYANNNPATNSDPSGLLGSASCEGGMVGGPGRCTGGEDGHHQDSMTGMGSSESTTTLENGNAITQTRHSSYINNVDVTQLLLTYGAPNLYQLAQGIDRYLGEHPPGGGQDIYDPIITWDAIYLAESNGYIKHPEGPFMAAIHSEHPDLSGAMTSAMMGPLMPMPFAGRLGRGGRFGACPHSFDPDTPVLMADGTTKAIKDIKVGDKVTSTDPASGQTTAEPVELLHNNTDTDLADVTVKAEDGKTETLRTTWHHPFWNASAGTWTDADHLTPGTLLHTADGHTELVTAVRTWLGEHEMRDLTVTAIHTYYVMAGNTPVLVHNDGGDDYNQARNKALAWLEERGFVAERTTYGKFGTIAGQPIGTQSADGKTGFRIEFDERNGAHINVWSGKEKGPHFNFDATESTVTKIQGQFGCK